MSIVETVLRKMQILPPDKQQVVLDFVDFLLHTFQRSQPVVSESAVKSNEVNNEPYIPKTPLGQKLYKIRQQAFHEGIQASDIDDVSSEIAEHRRHHSF